MKILKVFKPNNLKINEVEEYRLGERAPVRPTEFVKDIVYKNGDFSVIFSDDNCWFKSFVGMQCEYVEFCEEKNRSNKSVFQNFQYSDK